MSSQDGIPCLRLDTLSGNSSSGIQNHASIASTISTIETPQRKIFGQENFDPELSRQFSSDRNSFLGTNTKKHSSIRPSSLAPPSVDDVRNKNFWNCWPGQENEDANADPRSLSRRGYRSPSPSLHGDVYREKSIQNEVYSVKARHSLSMPNVEERLPPTSQSQRLSFNNKQSPTNSLASEAGGPRSSISTVSRYDVDKRDDIVLEMSEKIESLQNELKIMRMELKNQEKRHEDEINALRQKLQEQEKPLTVDKSSYHGASKDSSLQLHPLEPNILDIRSPPDTKFLAIESTPRKPSSQDSHPSSRGHDMTLPEGLKSKSPSKVQVLSPKTFVSADVILNDGKHLLQFNTETDRHRATRESSLLLAQGRPSSEQLKEPQERGDPQPRWSIGLDSAPREGNSKEKRIYMSPRLLDMQTPQAQPDTASKSPAMKKRTQKLVIIQRQPIPGQQLSPEDPVGIGISFGMTAKGDVFITGMAPNGPAKSSGQIRRGDQLISVDGTEVNGWDVKNIVSLIIGPQGSFVRLELASLHQDNNKIR
uniref:PDZ domain-containing protein n=1 Tax=Guillardia theta TaxID=55529 RepID=A0A7S4NDN0_GUITH